MRCAYSESGTNRGRHSTSLKYPIVNAPPMAWGFR